MTRPNSLTDSTEKRLRAGEVRDDIVDTCSSIETNYIKLAQLLQETVEGGYFIHWGFSSFEEYVEGELGIGYRKAAYLVKIANVVQSLKIDWEEITGIGWTKMRILIPILQQEGEDAGEWIQLAEELSTRDLEKIVKDAKIGADISLSGTEGIVQLKFRVTKSQSEIILDALEHAKKAIESTDDVMALEHVAYEYFMAAESEPERMDMATAIEWLEKSYGVSIILEGREDLNKVIEIE